jgi:hypothetical protein
MRLRYITFTVLLLAGILQVSSQSLTERYSRQRPVVIACDNEHPPYMFINYKDEPSGSCVAISKTITEKMGLPCRIVMKHMAGTRQAFERGDADIILSDSRSYNNPAYFISKNVIYYFYANEDSVAEIRFIGKDHQLIEQIDDQFTRMKESGDIAAIQKRWAHPEDSIPEAQPIALYIAKGLLGIAALVLLVTIIFMLFIHHTHRNTAVLKGMVSQAPNVDHYYDIEDNQAAHDLIHKYEAILSNPFVAISFYDHNGHLITKNDAMRLLDGKDISSYRQPLYNADGEVANYFVAIRRPNAT